MAVKTVLQTPSEIFQVFSKEFPSAQASVDVNEEREITLTLSPSQQEASFLLQTAVTLREFSEALKNLSLNMQWAATTYSAVRPIDVKRFSIEIPLSDWQRFRRIMYEKAGNSCLNAILAFLQNPVDSATLIHLGLAPDQVENVCSDSDFAYFKELPKKWKEMTSEVKGISRTNFQRMFPNIAKRLFSEMAHRERIDSIDKGSDSYQKALEELSKLVRGQDWAKEFIASALVSRQKKNQVFLFAGPSGVGKTELAKACSVVRKNRFVRFNMNEFAEEMSVTKFFGASAGYAGSMDKPCFIKEMDQCQPQKIPDEGSTECSVVKNIILLFDELEKAHPKIKQSLLTILDEGYCSFSYTKSRGAGGNLNLKYYFENSVIICTSNLYKEQILELFHRGMPPADISQYFIKMNREHPLETSYSGELLGRVAVVPFGPVPRGPCYQTVIRSKLAAFIEFFKAELGCREICIENEPMILSALENRLYGEGVDLRRIERFFTMEVATAINRERRTFGDMHTKKLTFLCDKEGVFIKVSTFLEEIGVYTDTDIPIIRLV